MDEIAIEKYAAYKDSGVEWLGEVPESWEIRKVKSVFRLVVEPAPKNNDFELLSVYTDIGVKPRKELEERGNKASTTDGYWFVKKGDIVVNKLLAWMGAIGVSNYNGVTSPAYDILRAKVKIEGNYFHYLFRNSACISELKRHSRGIMDMRLRLYFDKFGDIIIPFPDYITQKKIVDFLDRKTAQVDYAISIKEKQIELLKERWQILIHKAVTRGLNPNVKLKHSGVEWIGEIPEGWEVKKIKHFGTIKSGDSVVNSLLKETGQYEVFGGNGYMGYYDKFNVEGNKIIIGRVGAYCGNVRLINEKKWISDNALILTLNNSELYPYLATLLEIGNLNNLNSSNAQPLITGSKVLNFQLPIPLETEQVRIQSFISVIRIKIATAISIKEKEIEKLKEYKASLINSVVTGKIKVC